MGSVTMEGRYARYGEGICRVSLCGRPSVVFPRSLKVFFLGAMEVDADVWIGTREAVDAVELRFQTAIAAVLVGRKNSSGLG